MEQQHDDLLGDAVEQLLAGIATPAATRTVEAAGAGSEEARAMWAEIEASGFCDALVPESLDGAGLGLRDAAPVFEACGRHALALPLGQTLAARALLGQAGAKAPAGPIALGEGTATEVAVMWLVQPQSGALELRDIGGAPLLSVKTDAELRPLLATVLAAQMAGAMRQVMRLTLQYANDRVQFGRSIGRYQAIQHQLSVMAELTAAATMAARLPCATDATTPDPLRAAVAKARTSAVAGPLAAMAHAVHGAIGMTEEHDLQLLTRRLQAWRVAAGTESYWHQRIGSALLVSGTSIPVFVRETLLPA